MDTSHRSFKDGLYREFARIGQALSSAKRLEMLELLAQRERTVENVADELGLSVANASKHLKVLAAVRLAESRRSGTFVHYRLAGSAALRLLRLVGDFGEDCLPEVQALVRNHLGDRSAEALPLDALASRVRRGAVLLDVRPAAEYHAGHIPGARSAPLDTLKQKGGLKALAHSREIIVYCRGPFCLWADEAIDLLRRRGYKAYRLLSGAPDWFARAQSLDSAS